MQKRYESFTTLILQLNRSVQHIKSVEMATLNLKGVHASCLAFLKENGSMTQSELTRMCAEDKATISRAVATLMERGLVECPQQGSSSTRRYRGLLALTEEGSRLAERVCSMVEAAVTAGGSGLTDEERSILYRCLRTVNENLYHYVQAEC